MIVVVCLDEAGGMLFNGRRQSKDRLLRQKLLERCGDVRLWMNAYTARQFELLPMGICVDESFMDKAAAGEYCFVENIDITPYLGEIEGIVLYRWNRSYPADVYFPGELCHERKKLVSKQEFAGSSHDRITEEVYVL